MNDSSISLYTLIARAWSYYVLLDAGLAIVAILPP